MTWVNTAVRFSPRGMVLRIPWEYEVTLCHMEPVARIEELSGKLRQDGFFPEGAQVYAYRMCHDRAAEELTILSSQAPEVEGLTPLPVFELVKRINDNGFSFWATEVAAP